MHKDTVWAPPILCHLKEMWIELFGVLFLCSLCFFPLLILHKQAYGLNIRCKYVFRSLGSPSQETLFIVRTPQKCCGGMHSISMDGFQLFLP